MTGGAVAADQLAGKDNIAVTPLVMLLVTTLKVEGLPFWGSSTPRQYPPRQSSGFLSRLEDSNRDKPRSPGPSRSLLSPSHPHYTQPTLLLQWLLPYPQIPLLGLDFLSNNGQLLLGLLFNPSQSSLSTLPFPISLNQLEEEVLVFLFRNNKVLYS